MRSHPRFALIGLLLCSTPLVSILERSVAAEPPTFTLEGNELKVPDAITFETGSDKLTPASDAALAYVKSYLDAKSYISQLRIEVHTDGDGDAQKNLELSRSRALAVAKKLTTMGVACDRLVPVGFGGTKPIAANDTPENKAKNRRVSFVNAALRGRAIGGMPVDGGGAVAGDPCH